MTGFDETVPPIDAPDPSEDATAAGTEDPQSRARHRYDDDAEQGASSADDLAESMHRVRAAEDSEGDEEDADTDGEDATAEGKDDPADG